MFRIQAALVKLDEDKVSAESLPEGEEKEARLEDIQKREKEIQVNFDARVDAYQGERSGVDSRRSGVDSRRSGVDSRRSGVDSMPSPPWVKLVQSHNSEEHYDQVAARYREERAASPPNKAIINPKQITPLTLALTLTLTLDESDLTAPESGGSSARKHRSS